MKKTKKHLSIALIYDDSLDGAEGVSQQVKLIGGWMSGRGHNVSYFVGQTKLNDWFGGKVYSLASNIKVKFNGNQMTTPSLASSRRIVAALKEQKPDVLHVQMPHSPFLAQRVLSFSRAPAIGTFHIYPASRLVLWGSKLLKLLYFGGLKRISPVVSVSEAAQEFAASAFGLTTKVVPNAIDAKKLRSVQKNQPNTIIFLGRLVDRKGCAELLKAFALVNTALPSTKLIVGGKGPQLKRLQVMADSLGISASVEFKGFIAEEDKADFLAQATIACFPSLYGESFGIVLAEAMTAGSAVVIGGDNPGYRSVLKPQPKLLIDPKDTQLFADRLLFYLNSPEQRQKIKKWQTGYCQQFDINIVGPMYEKLYAEAIAKSGHPGHNNS
jgi:phosphatidylinositol alpha-mannosyltransferase